MATFSLGKVLLFAVFIAYAATLELNLTESAACHGTQGLQQTSNFLFCDTQFVICVQQVWFYEHIPTESCPSSEITSPISPLECCQTQTGQCYWKANASDISIAHDECNATRTVFGSCVIPARESRLPPSMSLCSNASSIRSIFFSCENGTCPEIVPDATTTEGTTSITDQSTNPTDDSSPSSDTSTPGAGPTAGQITDPEDPDNNAALIGGIIGGVAALIIIIAITYVMCRNKRRKHDKLTGEKDSSLENGGHINKGFSSEVKDTSSENAQEPRYSSQKGKSLSSSAPLDAKAATPEETMDHHRSPEVKQDQPEPSSDKPVRNPEVEVKVGHETTSSSGPEEKPSPQTDFSNLMPDDSAPTPESKPDQPTSAPPSHESALSGEPADDLAPKTDDKPDEQAAIAEVKPDHQASTVDDGADRPSPPSGNETDHLPLQLDHGTDHQPQRLDDEMDRYQTIDDYSESTRM